MPLTRFDAVGALGLHMVEKTDWSVA